MAANGKKPRHLLEEADSKFARALGSTDYHTREAGLAALTAWLAKRNDVEELELLKLWRGVFYTFWHSDKHAVQVSCFWQPSSLSHASCTLQCMTQPS